jgi:hypothetical protein
LKPGLVHLDIKIQESRRSSLKEMLDQGGLADLAGSENDPNLVSLKNVL